MNFLGQDRPDVQFATKQASHKMATPTETDLPRLKRIARSSHGGEVLVAAGRTRERAAELEKGAYVCQPC